jgi:hypothetical protein
VDVRASCGKRLGESVTDRSAPQFSAEWPFTLNACLDPLPNCPTFIFTAQEFKMIFTIVAGIFLGLYLVPTLIAWIRGHEQKVAITALNLLLGWSVIGWIGSLVWSLTSPPKPQQTIIVDTRTNG